MGLEYAIGDAPQLMLGDFMFGLNTAAYQELSRSTSYRWASQERFGQGAALQFIGPGADTITLPGVVYPTFRGGLEQVRQMRLMAGLGEPLPMVDGSGNYYGQWIIEQVEEKQLYLAAFGVPLKQEFSLTLKALDPEFSY